MSGKIIPFILLLHFFNTASSQQSSIDSASFALHKFEQKIGRETYIISKTKTGISYQIDFKFTDRGRAVPLQAGFQASLNAEPKSFWIKGNTSRFSTIHDSVVIGNKTAMVKEGEKVTTVPLKGLSFPIAGYAPATMQMLLLQYWNKHGKPASIQTLPAGTLNILKDGRDTLLFENKKLILDRYVIRGLIWGIEMLWTDQAGKLICLITNDAEGDKIEVMSEPYDALLAQFLERTAIHGMRIFANTAGATISAERSIAIVGGDLLNINDGSLIRNTTVLIENGKIRNIGAADQIAVPKGTKIISGKGKTLLPGLWDMHAHFQQAEWGPAYLAAGITTVRDCGNELGYINTIKDAIDGHKGIGPEILKTGFVDGKGPRAAGTIQADTPEEGIAIVRSYKAAGFLQIKIYSSVKPAVVKAICDEAHRLGLTVTGHIPRGMNVMDGVNAGMDMVNHIQYVYTAMKIDTITGRVIFDDPASKAVFAFLKAHNTVIDPTLGVFELSGRSLSDSITLIEPAFSTLPLPLQSLFRNTGVSDTADIRFYKGFLADCKQITKQLVDDGIPVVAGTDMGMPGYSLYRELELYVNAGLTPLHSLQSATIIAAKVMKMDAQSGSIEAGKNADIILVDGNPLKDIRLIRKVSSVISAGRVYDPALLHKMSGFSVGDKR
jgi:imidazolonepropionase-like amidohydrolase